MLWHSARLLRDHVPILSAAGLYILSFLSLSLSLSLSSMFPPLVVLSVVVSPDTTGVRSPTALCFAVCFGPTSITTNPYTPPPLVPLPLPFVLAAANNCSHCKLPGDQPNSKCPAGLRHGKQAAAAGMLISLLCSALFCCALLCCAMLYRNVVPQYLSHN